MQHVGTRKEPSIRNLVVVVFIALILTVYSIISFATGDWLWFSNNFSARPNAVMLHCYGETTDIDPGSFHFSKLTEIMNESMSGRKRWDPLTMSEKTYEEYQTSPQMLVVEFFYPEPLRVHSTYSLYSSVDNLVIPLEGRHSQTNAVFGQNDGVPTGGSLHIESVDRFREYIQNMDLCPVKMIGMN